jgi:aerobic-type carbon monoxide dehydrogenase small subunit (CoxS/CutS family)
MTGNICRCATYHRIREGVQRAVAIAANNNDADASTVDATFDATFGATVSATEAK